MRGPFHEFLLVDAPSAAIDYLRYIHASSAVRLSEDLFGYLSDSFAWIPTLNPASKTPTRGFGLNHFGPTVVDVTGAPTIAAIFRAWSQLFANAPDEMKLRGWWSSNERAYEDLRLDKSVVVAGLAQVAALCDQVSESKYLLHLGI